MANYRVIVPMVFESELDLAEKLGTHFVEGDTARQVDVATTGTQVGEVVTMSLEGKLVDILAWMTEEWQDEELALDALLEARQEGRVEEM